MKKNLVKAKLRAGEPAIGTWLCLCSNLAAEYMAQVGWDWLAVDTQHSPIDTETATACFQAICTTNTTPLARVAGNDPILMKRLLDGGALGLVVPMVNTRDDAARAVDAIRYPPKGNRSIGSSGRCHLYGQDYVDCANDEMLIIVQAEHVDAVKNINEILAVEGVDGCFVGPNDLAGSLGIPYGKSSKYPEHEAAVQKVLQACNKAGKVAGITSINAADMQRRVDQGFRMVSCGIDHRFMSAAAADVVAGFRARGSK